LDHLDVEPARVWGYSQGAWIAQELALLRPDRVRGAVMMATVGRRSAYLQLALDAWEDLSGREEELPELYAYLMLLTSMSPDLFANDNYVTAVGQMMKGTTFDEEAMQRSRFASASMEDRVEALAAVAVPCLVIGFERDLMALPAHGEEVADAIPGCRYIEIPGAAHSGMATHADEVMKHVPDFFASV